jgi:hypothetical protein
MLEKMKPAEKGGAKIAIIFNGSPLSNGDCLSGESEIRRWILENDWLDTIVMLPDQLFYNTGIYTYIWLLSNVKPATKKDRVLIIDARKQFEKEPKAFGSKRNRQADEHRAWIEEQYRTWQGNDSCKVFKTKDFAYHKVKVVFWQTDESDQPAYITEPFERTLSNANVKKDQELYGDLDFSLKVKLLSDVIVPITFTLKQEESFAAVFERELRKATAEAPSSGLRPPSPQWRRENKIPSPSGRGWREAPGEGAFDVPSDPKAFKTFLKTLQIEAEYTHRHYVVDWEYIPFGEDIAAFLNREIGKQIINWEDSAQLGYEILPNKYFYRYQAPAPAKELLAEFWRLEKEAEKMLEGIGTTSPFPAKWASDRLKDITKINAESLPSSTDPEYEFDYLEISNVDYYGIVNSDAIERLSYENAPSRARRRVPKNSTVISSVRPNLQAVAFLPDVGDHFICSTGFNVVQPDETKLAPAFAHYGLISEDTRQYFESVAKGVGYPAVDDKDFSALNLPLPPLTEQIQIANYLDSSCAAIDEAVAAKQKQIETLENLRKSLIHECVTGKRRITGEVV